MDSVQNFSFMKHLRTNFAREFTKTSNCGSLNEFFVPIYDSGKKNDEQKATVAAEVAQNGFPPVCFWM